MRLPLAIFVIAIAIVALTVLAGSWDALPSPGTLKQVLYTDAAALESVGVLMVAWPDIEAKLRAYSEKPTRFTGAFVRGLPGRLRRVGGSFAWQIRRSVLAVSNRYRRRRSQPSRIEGRGAVSFPALGVQGSGSARWSGTVEERLSRVETEVAESPSRWSRDFASLRDARVAFRSFGLPLIIIGICINWWANIA